MAATPLFLETDAGLAAASVATPTGPYIHITSFQVGSAYGYTPQRTDPGLNGNLLYSGIPASYSYVGDNTIDILCQIPAAAGPFDFGEVGLFLDGGVMFAKAVFDTPQTKYSALGTNIVSTYSFHCLLKLQQSVAVFQIDTSSGIPPAVWVVDQWSDVYPAGISANPDIPLIMCRELSIFGDSTLLQNTSDAIWTVGTTYEPYLRKGLLTPNFTVANASTTWVEVPAAQCHPLDLTVANRVMLLETTDGFFRSVSSVVTSGSNYRFNLNTSNDGTYNNSPLLSAPAVNSNVKLYRSEGAKFYSEIVDPPAPPVLATLGTPGLAFGSNGTYMPSPGVIQAHGMLQNPSINTGRQLTGANNLNDITLSSGLYFTNGGGGYPANMPFAYPANIWVHNIGNGVSSANGSDVTQIAYPWNTGGGDGNGVGGLPPYWRQGYNNGASWTTWQPYLVANKQGAAIARTATAAAPGTTVNITVPNAGNWVFSATARAMQNAWNGAQLYINGSLVNTNTVYGDQDGIGYGILIGALQLNGLGAGSVITVTSNWSGLSPGPDIAIMCNAFQVG